MAEKILVIDDDELMLEALEFFLIQEDFQIRSVAKAERVGLAIADFKPDLIVMDIHLEISGISYSSHRQGCVINACNGFNKVFIKPSAEGARTFVPSSSVYIQSL